MKSRKLLDYYISKVKEDNLYNYNFDVSIIKDLEN